MNKKKFPKHLYHSHATHAIRARLKGQRTHSYLRDIVYGSIDGTITTFAVVAGVVGANLENKAILILGFANLIADGFSMAASNYLGTKTEHEERLLCEEFEKKQIDTNPEGEKEEVRQILLAKGYTGDLLGKAVELHVSDKQRWADFMVKEEYGLADEIRSPWIAGVSTFFAFLFFGLIPLLPFLVRIEHSFLLASIATGAAFFLAGSFKSYFTTEAFWLAGLKTLLIGAIAATLAYGVGFLLKEIV